MAFNFIINRWNIVFLILITCMFYQSTASAESCHRNADNKIIVADTTDTPVSHDSGSNYDQDSCNEEPLFYKVKIFEVMMCASDPFVAGSGDTGSDPDFTSCTNLFTNSSGKDIEITPNVKTDLFDGSVTLPLGNFPYSVIIVSNHLKIKHYETYIDTGDNDADIRGYGASDFSSGKTCWTHEGFTTYTGYSTSMHGKTILSTSAGTSNSLGLICGDTFDADSTSTYEYTTEILDSIDATCDASNDCDTTFRPYVGYQANSEIDGSYAGVLLQNDRRTVGSNRDNSTTVAYIINFNNPLIITEEVKTFEMLFDTKSSVSIDWGAAASVTNAVKMGVDPFKVKYTISN